MADVEVVTVVQAPEQQRVWTYQDYLELDDETRYQILEGELLMIPSPDVPHQDSSRDLEFLLWGYVKARRLGKVYNAPIDVIFDAENVTQPDIVFVARENRAIIQHRGIFGAPDMVVEIISPSSRRTDRQRKKLIYERFGVKEYWIVDPARQTVEVFILTSNGYTLFSSATVPGCVTSQVVAGFTADLAEFLIQDDYDQTEPRP